VSTVNRLRILSPRGSGDAGADSVATRVEALRRFLAAAEGHLPEQRLAATRTVVDRAGERLALSREHTVVALAGATGSGKSSLFNALAKLRLSKVGVTRPTTGVAHACVWSAEGPGPTGSRLGSAGPLLDWLGVPPAQRFVRESALDGDDEAALRGLVLLDLPDFDSIEESHRVEVDRLLGLVDLVVWVLDPQKYADNVVHHQYLARLRRYRDITVVVLNQADLLSPADAHRCVADLRNLLDADGMTGVPAFATSAVVPRGLNQLRMLLERAVASKYASLHRLAGDVGGVVAELAPLMEPKPPGDEVDTESVRALNAALAQAAGVPAVVAATERAYQHRAAQAMGWPLLRWVRRLRPDPLRRLHLTGRGAPAIEAGAGGAAMVPATSLPPATSAQVATVALAVRQIGERAGGGLPPAWQQATLAAARSHLDDLPDALDRAVGSTDLGVSRTPLWWRLVGGAQWLAAFVALVGLAWLALRYLLFALALPLPPGPEVGRLPLPTLLLLGGLLAGLLIGVLARPLIRFAARQLQAKAGARLRTAVDHVGERLVVSPVRGALRGYAQARSALAEAAGPDRTGGRAAGPDRTGLTAAGPDRTGLTAAGPDRTGGS
jgi:energy-coupling factor transporter ATP-binding protein EcfA2